MNSRIGHLIVLMLENRSFDHALGFSSIPGMDGIPADIKTLPQNLDASNEAVWPTPAAEYSGDFSPDPGHDFLDVRKQLYNTDTPNPGQDPNMQGFVASYLDTCKRSFPRPRDHIGHSRSVMKCFSPERLSVLTTLARNYAVCDHWYSSIPGPTLPNRLFAHAGTSKGRLDLSADEFDTSPTIYEVLDAANVSSTIYAEDWTAAATFRNLIRHQEKFFGTLDDFYHDCADNDLPAYCFLEPRYSSGVVKGIFRSQNDQHPDSDMRAGEELVFSVYQAIRSNRRVWESSVLVIVYDEHGGLFDHVPPPRAIAPDKETSQDPPFDFTRYGLRVPAIIISAYTRAGTLCTQTFDHTSLIATARKMLTGKWQDDLLGDRAKSANTFDSALNLSEPRTDHVPIKVNINHQPDRNPRSLTDLQKKYLSMAVRLDRDLLSERLQTGINASAIQTDQQAQHYLSRVYSSAVGFARDEYK
jgi:phospholipase C